VRGEGMVSNGEMAGKLHAVKATRTQQINVDRAKRARKEAARRAV
jgi:hypothetical protein